MRLFKKILIENIYFHAKNQVKISTRTRLMELFIVYYHKKDH